MLAKDEGMVHLHKIKELIKRVERFFVRITEKSKKLCRLFFGNLIKYFTKLLAILKKISMGFLVGFAIVIHLVPSIWEANAGNEVEWIPLIVVVILLVLLAMLYYYKGIVRAFRIDKRTAALIEYSAVTTLVLLSGYFIGISIADGYFRAELDIFDRLFYGTICIMSMFFVYKCCKEIKELIDKECEYSKKTFLFILILLQIAQSFCLSYLSVICMNKSAFVFPEESLTANESVLTFEFFYFSAMTLLTVGGNLNAVSVLAKILVFLESAIFAVFISMIVFSGSFSKTKTGKAEKVQTAEEESIKPVP